MTEVFDELLVSLQSKTGTLRNGSSRRSRAVVKSSAPLSSASSSATSPPGSGGPIGGGGGGPPIRRAGRQNAGEGLSLSEGAGRPKSDFGLLSTTTNSLSTARPSAGGLTVWDRNVSVTDLVHQFLGDPPPQPPAASTNVENGWRAGTHTPINILTRTQHKRLVVLTCFVGREVQGWSSPRVGNRWRHRQRTRFRRPCLRSCPCEP
jgi:hypothetical protein